VGRAGDACFKMFPKFQALCVIPDYYMWTKFIKTVAERRKNEAYSAETVFFGELSIMKKHQGK